MAFTADRLLSRAELENLAPQPRAHRNAPLAPSSEQRPASKAPVGAKKATGPSDLARSTKAAPQARSDRANEARFRISPRSRSPQASHSRSPGAPADRAASLSPLSVVSTRASPARPRTKKSPSRPTRRSGAGVTTADRSTGNVGAVRYAGDAGEEVDDKRDTATNAGVLAFSMRDAQRDAQWRRLLATRSAELHNALLRERRALLRLALSEWRATTRASRAQIALIKRRAARVRSALLSASLAAWDAAAHPAPSPPRRDLDAASTPQKHGAPHDAVRASMADAMRTVVDLAVLFGRNDPEAEAAFAAAALRETTGGAGGGGSVRDGEEEDQWEGQHHHSHQRQNGAAALRETGGGGGSLESPGCGAREEEEEAEEEEHHHQRQKQHRPAAAGGVPDVGLAVATAGPL
ncbi:hypothetical protein T484DRAFT_1763087 [Baffinella frigidus]|nr:hypothetical protein T484DRAFT_1763087 [Cryptophyta sp. CCMP2293]